MRRTALRDTFSSRLISRRLWPCALRSFTPLRISIGIMFAIPLDVVSKTHKVYLRARQHPRKGEFWAFDFLDDNENIPSGNYLGSRLNILHLGRRPRGVAATNAGELLRSSYSNDDTSVHLSNS